VSDVNITLSRRDFLKLGLTASLVGGALSTIDWTSAITKAAEILKRGDLHIIWIESQDCAGDTIALLDATQPTLLEVLLGSFHRVGPGQVILSWHQTVMPQWGVEIDGKPGSFIKFAMPVVVINELIKLLKEVGPEKVEKLSVTDVLKVVHDFAAKLETEGVRIPTVPTPVKIPSDFTLTFITSIVKDITRLYGVPLEALPKVLANLARNLGPLTDILDGYAMSWPFESVDVLRLAEKGKLGDFVLVIEGAIPDEEWAKRREGWFSMVGMEHEKPITCTDWILRLASSDKCKAVVAVGTCASYGGLPANKVYQVEQMPLGLPEWSPSPTGAVGLFDDPIKGIKGLKSLYPDIFRGKLCIAVPGCPANGNAILRTLAVAVLALKGLMPVPELDEYGRPKFLFAQTLHEQCPRAGSYAAGDLRKHPGDPDYRCLFAVGCKGPVVNCPFGGKLGWINGVAGCVKQGAVCIGCTMPGFSDHYEPFFKPLPPPTPLTAAQATAAGIAAVGAGIGIAAAMAKVIKAKREKAVAGGE